MASATVTSKGQITIPVQVRTALGVDAGDRIEFVEVEKGQFAIVAATRSVQELKGRFQGKRSKPVSIAEMTPPSRGAHPGPGDWTIDDRPRHEYRCPLSYS